MSQGGSWNPTSELDLEVDPVEVTNVHLDNNSLGEEDLYQTSSAQDVIILKMRLHPNSAPGEAAFLQAQASGHGSGSKGSVKTPREQEKPMGYFSTPLTKFKRALLR